MDSGHESQGFFKSFLLVTIARNNQLFSCVIEHIKDIVVDLLQFLDRVSGCSLNHISWLRNSDGFEFESTLSLDGLKLELVLHCPEGDASSGSSSSRRSS